MYERYLKYPLLVLYGAAIVLAFHTRFSSNHIKLPQGCDEFGYLNMAKAASKGILFENHAARPFDGGLLAYLKQSPLPSE